MISRRERGIGLLDAFGTSRKALLASDGPETDGGAAVALTDLPVIRYRNQRGGDGRVRARSPSSQTRELFTL